MQQPKLPYILSPTALQAAEFWKDNILNSPKDAGPELSQLLPKAFQEILDITPIQTYFILKFPVDNDLHGTGIKYNNLQVMHFANLTQKQKDKLEKLFHYGLGLDETPDYNSAVSEWLCFGECDQQITFHGVETTILTISENY